MNSPKQRKHKDAREFISLKEIDRDILINKFGFSPEKVNTIFTLARARKQFYLSSEIRYQA